MVRRCFVSAPSGTNVVPLLGALRARGWEPFVISDVAELGASLVQNIELAIRSSNVVVVVLPKDRDAGNAAFELGLATGLGKRTVLLVEPGATIPSDLSGFLFVQAEADNIKAIAPALDNLDRLKPQRGVTAPWATGKPLGQYVDQLLLEAGPARAMSEAQAQRTLVRAIEASGAKAVPAEQADAGFDIAIWSDDLASIDGNPLFIEVKRHARAGTPQQLLAALSRYHGPRIALLVSLEETPTTHEAGLRLPVLSISFRDLLERMRNASFAEVVRTLRNRSVHGLPG